MGQEPVEIGNYGLLIRMVKMPDGNIVINTKTKGEKIGEELIINVLENHLHYLKEQNYKKYALGLEEFKE